jgi:hypothetical protein
MTKCTLWLMLLPLKALGVILVPLLEEGLEGELLIRTVVVGRKIQMLGIHENGRLLTTAKGISTKSQL